MKKVICILGFSLILGHFSFAQTDSLYQQTLSAMFEASGTEGAYQSVIIQMFSIFKEQYTDVSKEVWAELEQDFLGASMNDLVVMLVPVYQKYMSQEDLEEIIKFYQSPVGKKFAENTPMITQESMQLGQQWGMKIGQEFQRKMKERGY